MKCSQTIIVNMGGFSNKKLTGSQCSNWGSLASKLNVSKWPKFKGKPKISVGVRWQMNP